MPTYSYRCLHCHHVESRIQGMFSGQVPACSACGGLTEKIIGQAPAILKTSPTARQVERDKNAAIDADNTHDCHSGCVLHRKRPPGQAGV